MKKLLSILVIGVLAVAFPLKASAAPSITGSCEKDETNCPDDVCQSVCTIRVTGNDTTIQTFEGDLVFTPSDGGQIVSVTPGDEWTNLSGNDAHINFIAANGTGVTSSDFTLATVVLNVDKDITGCTLRLQNPSVGTQVEIEVETTNEVKTGATLPIAILVCGVAAGTIFYVVSKKNKKLYKI